MRYLPLVVAFAAACSAAGADPAPGASEQRKVDSFHGIDIVGTLEVEARVDRTTRVEVFADPADLLSRITTTVKNGVLVLGTGKGKLPAHSRLRAVISAPALDTLSISGTGDMRVTNLAGGTLDVSIGGTGALQLTGKVNELRLSVGGTGEIRAKDLIAASAVIDMGGTGDATVHATESVDARISGTGAIRIHGRPPTIRKSVSGTGVIDVR
jgi:hypothetical protein